MPGRTSSTPRRRPTAARVDPWRDSGTVLVLIDDAPLKRAAWAELHAARKRQEKAARDLHRHEQLDRPAYDEWLHQTFPTFVTRLRELHHEVFGKAQRVRSVQEMAALTGRPARKLWRELKDHEANRAGKGNAEDSAHDDFFEDDDEADFSDGSGRRPRGQARARAEDDGFEPRRPDRPAAPRPSTEARDVYRRLVQRLHPDRGGDWTVARQRLWHEVQQAWAAGDADWLTRLEVEWEAANDVLDAASPLSRLRGAIAEFHAARRDTERKLRAYRGSPPWRFTLTEKKREQLHRRTELNFRHDIVFLERQLAHLDALIAKWEQSSADRRLSRARHLDARFYD